MSDLAGASIEVQGLTKRFGRGRRSVLAVDDLSFTVRPGRVTGFLGPNGSGKTTTLRCALGLVRPTSGRVLVGGAPYAALADPLQTVGAALEASGFTPGRTGRNHCRVLAAAAGLPDRRVEEVLEEVGLLEAAGRRVVEYSLGMRQRLALAVSLLGDPSVLVLDEPANGLDPEGIAWLRGFLRERAARGGTVLVSSHVLSEVQQTVDDVVIVNRGALVQAGPLDSLTDGRGSPGAVPGSVLVRSPDTARLAAALAGRMLSAQLQPDGALLVTGASPDEVGHAAFAAGCELHELSRVPGDLERLFLTLTADTPPDGAP